MNDHPAPPTDAAEWFLAIHAAEEPSAETVQAWLRWLDAAPENRRAFEDIVRIWHATPSAVIAHREKTSAAAEYDGSISIAEWRRRRQATSTKPGRRGRPFLAIAAGVLLATVGVASYRVFVPSGVTQGDFATRTGEHRQIELADGSRITLGAHSTLSVDLKSESRELRLSAGEAYFSVAKDARRPFVVRALNGEIVALGTAFNVRAVEGRVTVTVTEGSVKVTDTSVRTAALDTALAPAQRLSRGEQLTFEEASDFPAAVAEKAAHVDVNESARWREGWLVYRDEPLKYVIADILRYTNLQVDVTVPAADVKFSGAVFKDDIDEWIIALPEVASVTVERAGDGYIIRSKPAGATVAAGAGPPGPE
jgi:transmembrane sensor